MEKDTFKILKVINNNVILALEESTGYEVMAIGKGIGFGRKNGEVYTYDHSQIEKTYVSRHNTLTGTFFKLMEQIDIEVIGVSQEIIFYAEKQLGKLNDHIHIALTDHIGFTVERLKEGLIIDNPFLFEIKTMYSEEYEVGEKAAVMLKERLGIEIPDSEKAFIALHLSSARQDRKITDTMKDTKTIREIIEIINSELGMEIQNDKLSYTRLLTHLKYVISVADQNMEIENPLLVNIKKDFKKSFKVSKKIAQYIEKNLSVKMSEHEIGYLALHIERIQRLKNK